MMVLSCERCRPKHDALVKGAFAVRERATAEGDALLRNATGAFLAMYELALKAVADSADPSLAVRLRKLAPMVEDMRESVDALVEAGASPPPAR